MSIENQIGQAEDKARDIILAIVSQEDVNTLAADDFTNPDKRARYTSDNASVNLKHLADDTFGSIKHFLRGKIHAGVDIAWGIGEVRSALRTMANIAAAAQLQ